MSTNFSISRVLPLTTTPKGYGVEIVFSNSTPEAIWIERIQLVGSANTRISFNATGPLHHALTYHIQLQCGLTAANTGESKTYIKGKISEATEPLWAYVAEGEFNHEFSLSKGKLWGYSITLPVLISVAPGGKAAARLVFAPLAKRTVREERSGTEPLGMFIMDTSVDCWLRATTDKNETTEVKMDDSFLAFLSSKKSAPSDKEAILKNIKRAFVPTKTRQRKPKSLLFLTADPTDASRLRVGEELREVQEKLQLARLRERFVIHSRTSVRATDLSQALLDIKPRIAHFSGHGTKGGGLCIESPTGEVQSVSPDALASLFKEFRSHLECVVLNACYSEKQAQVIAQHIPYVVGMSEAIGDKAAIAFAVGFYQGLGGGRDYEESYRLGCIQIRLQGIPEHLTPVLLKK